MTRPEMERQIRSQVLGAMRDGIAMNRAEPRQAELRLGLILANVDAFLEAEAKRGDEARGGGAS